MPYGPIAAFREPVVHLSASRTGRLATVGVGDLDEPCDLVVELAVLLGGRLRGDIACRRRFHLSMEAWASGSAAAAAGRGSGWT